MHTIHFNGNERYTLIAGDRVQKNGHTLSVALNAAQEMKGCVNLNLLQFYVVSKWHSARGEAMLGIGSLSKESL